jgi:hypothetical protein
VIDSRLGALAGVVGWPAASAPAGRLRHPAFDGTWASCPSRGKLEVVGVFSAGHPWPVEKLVGIHADDLLRRREPADLQPPRKGRPPHHPGKSPLPVFLSIDRRASEDAGAHGFSGMCEAAPGRRIRPARSAGIGQEVRSFSQSMDVLSKSPGDRRAPARSAGGATHPRKPVNPRVPASPRRPPRREKATARSRSSSRAPGARGTCLRRS